jgi:hypothetical protein
MRVAIIRPPYSHRPSFPAGNMFMRSLSRKRSKAQALGLILGAISFFPQTLAFDPYEYPRKTVQCDAIRREPTPEQVKIEMSECI